ncbi:hypothetical protein GWL_28690 [Herbaspirillum sp. GW103]|nr:hypothetical protein GWL_28690 [Herbaspirillum sp. GW103]
MGCFGNGHEADIIPATARPVRLDAAGGPMVQVLASLAVPMAPLCNIRTRNLLPSGPQAYGPPRRWL